MRKPLIATLALLAFAGAAQAHPGHAPQGFASGLVHPLLGIDHLLAAVAVGLFAAQRGGRATWALPATFLVALVAGGVATALGISVPAVEPVVLASVLVLGLAVASAAQPPLRLAAAMTVLFAFAHGAAHGAECAPASAFAGLVASTVALLLAGLALGLGARRLRAELLLRLAGTATFAVGWLLLSR